MRSKKVLDALKKALQQDYLYDADELKFMREQLLILQEEVNNKKNNLLFSLLAFPVGISLVQGVASLHRY